MMMMMHGQLLWLLPQHRRSPPPNWRWTLPLCVSSTLCCWWSPCPPFSLPCVPGLAPAPSPLSSTAPSAPSSPSQLLCPNTWSAWTWGQSFLQFLSNDLACLLLCYTVRDWITLMNAWLEKDFTLWHVNNQAHILYLINLDYVFFILPTLFLLFQVQ